MRVHVFNSSQHLLRASLVITKVPCCMNYEHILCVVYHGVCRGAFSEVYRAVQKDTHKEFAIKVIKKDALKGKEEALQMEVQVLQKLVMYSFSSSHTMSTSSFRSAVLRHTFYKYSCLM